MYHYTEGGLTNVWLSNGFREEDTPYGKGVSIEDVEGLHRVIGMKLVKERAQLTGAEFRFLRKELGLSQAKLAHWWGYEAQSVAGVGSYTHDVPGQRWQSSPVLDSLFGSLHNATYETYKVLGGFALGLPHTATYFGQLFFSCGPMWYLLSLMIAWVLLDLILNIFPEQYINWAVLGTMLLGWGICITWEAPFCIGQGMVTVPALYVGYLAKKYKIFEQPLSPRLRGGMIAAALAVAALVLLTKSTDCVSMAEWTFGPVSILLDAVTGLGILSIVIWFQRRVENVVTHAIQAIGRRSLFIFCVHTVELTAIPWYLMPQKFAAHPVLGMVLQFTLSLGSTLLICELLVRRRDLKFWLTSRREQKAAEAPRRRSARTEAPERHFAAKH